MYSKEQFEDSVEGTDSLRQEAHDVWREAGERALLDFAVGRGMNALGVSSVFAERIALSTSLVDFARTPIPVNDATHRIWFRFDEDSMDNRDKQSVVRTIGQLELGDIDATLAREKAQTILEAIGINRQTQKQHRYYPRTLIYEIEARDLALKYTEAYLRGDAKRSNALKFDLVRLTATQQYQLLGKTIRKIRGLL